jgi:hypothetical protein
MPGGQGDELPYDSGGGSLWMAGVFAACAIIYIAGVSFGFGIPTTAVAVVALGILGSAWFYYKASILYPRRRAEKMREVAATLGFAYHAEVPPEQLEQLSQIPPFSRGHSHRAHNMLVGTYYGVPVCLVDYYYRTGHGKDCRYWWQTVVMMRDVSEVPDFHLAPRHFLHKVAELFGYQNIKFSGEAARDQFSGKYLLRGTDEQAIRVALDGRLVEYLAGHPGWSVSCSGGTLVVWRTEHTKAEASAHFKLTSRDPNAEFRYLVPAAIPRLLVRAVEIRRLFQRHNATSDEMPTT